jgi:hypothetical protein
MPDEPWNHLEISGSAWGKMYLEGEKEKLLFERPKDQEKTFHLLPSPIRGQKIRFENVEQEEPIGELSAYNVTSGVEPQGARPSTSLNARNDSHSQPGAPIMKFIAGRYTTDNV